jgi:hypothetical protein
MSEPACSARRPGQRIHGLKQRLFELREHQLGDAVPAPDRERFVAEIEKDDPDFAPVICIDGARPVQHADPVLQRQSAPGPDLSLVSFGDSDRDPGRDELPCARADDHSGLHRRIKIDTGRVFGLIMRKR